MVGLGPGIAFSHGLDLEAVLERVDETVEVQRALVARQSALAEVELAMWRGDPSLSVSPGLRADGYDERSEVDRWTATVSLNATVPIGLSDDQYRRLERARDAAALAENNLEQTRLDQTARLVRLYHTAWLSEREVAVLEMETAVLGEQTRIDRLRFDQGEISWDALLRSESDYRERQADLSDAVAATRSAIIDLALATGIEPAHVGELAPPLDVNGSRAPGAYAGEDGPKGPGASVMAQEYALAAAVREASRTAGYLSQATIRAGVDLGDHSATLSWSILSPSVSLGYSPAPFVLHETGTSGSSGRQDYDWTVSLGVTIGLSGTRSDQIVQTTRDLAVERETAMLAYIIAHEEAQTDAAVARMEKAERNLENAEAALARAEVALEIMRTRAGTGQARTVELQQAEAALERGRFNYDRARLALVEASLDLARTGRN